MGLRTIAGQIKTALALKRVADEFEKETTMNHDWAKTLRAAGLDFLLTCAAVLVAYLADPVNLAAALNLVPEHLRLALVPILSALFVALRKRIKHGGPVNPDLKAGALAGALALCLLAPPAIAQEPAPKAQNTVSLSSGMSRFVTPGIKDTKELEVHLGARIHTPALTITEAFVRWTRTQGADAGSAGLIDPKTFAAVVGDVSVSRSLTSYLDATCLVGVTWNRDGDFDPADPRLWSAGCGVTVRTSKGALSVIPGWAGQVGGVGVGGKLVIPQGDRGRYVGTYQLPFQTPALYRSNPGNYTFGFQFDAWTRKF